MKDPETMFSLWTSKHSQRNSITPQNVAKTVTQEQMEVIRGAFLNKVDDERLSSYKAVHNETALARLFG